nr:MaoC family dehydratase N-terminal domain-containing protein [uncultured Alsobacter sp.]
MTMQRYRRFDEVEVGEVFPAAPLTFTADGEKVAAFLAATGNDGRLYRDGEALARVPSMIACVYLIDLLTARRSPPGGIHAKQTLAFHRPLRLGETLSIQGRVTEKYVRKERPYVVSTFEAHGEDGSLVSSGQVTSIWGRDP